MQFIVLLSFVLGTALASTANHANITVYTLPQVRGDVRYGPVQLPPLYSPFLDEVKLSPVIFVHPVGGKLTAAYVQDGFQGLGRFPEHVQSLQQGDKYMVLAYPWQMPRNVVDQISGLDILASASHGQVGISQLTQLATEINTRPILLVQSRTKNQLIQEEQLNEVGTIQVTREGDVKIVRDVVAEHLQDPKYGSFFNPSVFAYQGYNNLYPFNFGYGFPSFGFQSHYPGHGHHGSHPSFSFQAQYPYNEFSTYPFYGFQGQYPGYGYQGQYYNYGPAEKQSPTFPGYSHYMGYNGVFPGYGGSYFYPTAFGNHAYPFGYNYVPRPYYPGFNPFFFYGQRTQQEDTTKGYQYGSYSPFTFYAQKPQYQYGYQYQGYPFSYYQAYPFYQPGAKSYQYTPYQFQEYQYQPYQFQQYQPYHYPQYQPFQYQYYQSYQPYYGQYYPQ